MSTQAVLLPLFVQIALTFILWLWMAYCRATLTVSGKVRAEDVALREPNWPPHVLQVSNAAHNQLETPVLFYVLTVLAIVTHRANSVFVVLAWLYVATRLVHAYIHVTSNRVSVRGPVFGASLIVLIVMWVIFAARIQLVAG
jgi:hypothetical protein